MLLFITGPYRLQIEQQIPKSSNWKQNSGFPTLLWVWPTLKMLIIPRGARKQFNIILTVQTFWCHQISLRNTNKSEWLKKKNKKKIKTIPGCWRRPLCETSWGQKTCTRSSATERASLLICRCLLLSTSSRVIFSAFSLCSWRSIFQAALDEATEPWGIKVERVEM